MPGSCDRLEPPPEQLGQGREVRCLLYSDVKALESRASTEPVVRR